MNQNHRGKQPLPGKAPRDARIQAAAMGAGPTDDVPVPKKPKNEKKPSPRKVPPVQGAERVRSAKGKPSPARQSHKASPRPSAQSSAAPHRVPPATNHPTAPWERQPERHGTATTAELKIRHRKRLLAEPKSPFFSRPLANWLMRLGILAAVAGLVFYCSLTFFPVESIQVVSTEHISSQQIVDALDVHLGDRMLYLPTRSLSASLTQAIPWAESVRFVRKLPGTLVVQVQEAEPAVKIVTHQVAYLLDGDCRVLDYSTAASCEEEAELTLVGLEVAAAVPGQTIDLGDDLRMRTLQTLMETFREGNEDAEGMRTLYCSSITDIGVAYEGRLMIQIGDITELEKKLALVRQVLPKLESTDVGFVYVRSTEAVRFLADSAAGERISDMEKAISGVTEAAVGDLPTESTD